MYLNKELNQLAFKRLELKTIILKNKNEATKPIPKVVTNIDNNISLKNIENFQSSLLTKKMEYSDNKNISTLNKQLGTLTNNKIDNYKKDSYFFKYSRINEYKKLSIELASPEKIRKWAERLLPTGKIVGLVLNANTLHHKTLKPLKGGLFCERIFGPTKDFRCACGKTITKRQRKQNTSYSPGLISLLTPTSKPLKRFFCKLCEVEYTWALTRRYQLGYISLAFPVTHLWYTKGFSNPISLLFDIHKYDLDNIIYCSQTTSIEKSYELSEMNISTNTSLIFDSLKFSKTNQFILSKPYKLRKKLINKTNLIKNTTKIYNVSNTSITLLKDTNFLLKNNKINKLLNLNVGDIFHSNIVKYQSDNVIIKGTIKGPQDFDFLKKDFLKKGEGYNNILDKDNQKASFLKSNKLLNSYLIKKNKKQLIHPSVLVDSSNVYLENNEEQNSIQEQSSFESFNQKVERSFTNESLLLKSLATPLLAIYSTKEFAPFVLWLLATVDSKSISNEDQLNTLITMNVFKQLFYKEENIYIKELNSSDFIFSFRNEISKNLNLITDKDNITKITNILIDLKSVYTTSLNSLEKLPNIVERKYHKYLIQLRQDSYLLPKEVFKKLNKQIYKESYILSNQLVKQCIHKLKLENNVFQNYLNNEYNLENKNITTLLDKLSNKENTTIVRLRYFINKLKEIFNTKINPSYIKKQKIDDNSNGTFQNLNLNELAIQFLIYKLNKKTIRYFETNKFYKYNINTTLNKNMSKKITHFINVKTNSPVISFYYNIYSIADDQLWENINDWNLIKSYITLNPDVMDKPIPAYSHRIPVSGLSNLDYKIETNSISNSKILKYKNLLKKYYLNQLKNEFTLFNEKLNDSNLLNYQQFSKNINYKQALPLKSTGAGILNKLLKSLTSNELKSMDQQLTILLKESRKNILSYKTKIVDNRNYSNNLKTKDLSKNEYKELNKKHLVNFNLIQNFSQNQVLINKTQNNDYIQQFNLNKIKETKISNTVVIKEQQRFKSSNLRTDRYYGIDKWMEKYHELLRRSKIIRKFSNTNLSPKSMILTVIPVLPPDLRPIMKMADQIATSDLNRLYQRVLYRNERLKKIVMQLSDSNSIGITSSFFKTIILESQIQQQFNFSINNIKDSTTSLEEKTNRLAQSLNITNSLDTPLFGYEKHYAQRLLQEAVDNLIDNGRAGANSEKDAKGRALKSLSEVLKGKQGRFRQYLLGKRVDYSGRSVIVVGPKLKIHQCGLPREMAIELYLPFIIQYLIQMKYTKTVVGAKSLIGQNKELIESILHNVVHGHPIILNRAPTLHRLGFQAFQPILVEGRAILLHPMACTAFNADFDGDQMAVHIPITIEARSEAWRLMLARNNLLSPATGEPIILPSQDMVLGCYYLTTTRKFKKQHYLTSNEYYSDLNTVLYNYHMGKLHIHSPIWLKTEKTVLTDSIKKPVEIRICNFGTIQEIYMTTEYHYTTNGKLIHQYIRTTPGRIMFNLIIKNI